jgi:hypothetical protein
MDKDGGQRRLKREELDTPIEVIWKDRLGSDRYVSARTLDISELGMRVELPVPLDET